MSPEKHAIRDLQREMFNDRTPAIRLGTERIAFSIRQIIYNPEEPYRAMLLEHLRRELAAIEPLVEPNAEWLDSTRALLKEPT